MKERAPKSSLWMASAISWLAKGLVEWSYISIINQINERDFVGFMIAYPGHLRIGAAGEDVDGEPAAVGVAVGRDMTLVDEHAGREPGGRRMR